MSDGITRVAETRAGGAIVDVEIALCRDVHLLGKILTEHTAGVRMLFADPEWPLRFERDPEVRRVALTEIANLGLILARLTELIEDTPVELRDHALNHEALRAANATLSAIRGRVVPFPKAAAS